MGTPRRIIQKWRGRKSATRTGEYGGRLGTLRSLVRLRREHAADAAARISNVAVITRNEMHVHVHPRLATGLADVHADVVAVRRMLLVDLRLRLVQERDDRVLLLGGHVEEIGDVAHRNDEDMSTAEREIVVPYIGERVAQHHVLLDAQRARLVRHCFSVARNADYIHSIRSNMGM